MFTITTADVRQAAVIQAAGHQVEVHKKPCSTRCIFEFADTPEINRLIDAYERRRTLSIPPKSIMNAYTNLLSACKALKVGRI
jgi:aminoglycoside phosphotransferase (APT) family kinase protein